jgi:hypothetical protein
VKYLLRKGCKVSIQRPDNSFSQLDPETIQASIEGFDSAIKRLRKFEVDIFGLLGMRNLSSFVGELFGSYLLKESKGWFIKNPHQDGYPDLLLLDKFGMPLWESLASRVREKAPFSPFASGGIEIKATVGSVPTPKALAKKNMTKPDIGDERIGLLKAYDWKAHHRDTNNLIGVFWDFINGAPSIVGVFYSNQLSTEHWGKIIQPREGGGRTTSVSIMTREGVAVMYKGWLVVLDDDRYIRFLNSHNRGSLITREMATQFDTRAQGLI